ncbi:MAG TPA: hypothetical protein VHW09_26955 [Bryobacteraceae bacterium]|jgi:hypothetical protein|nr:hypothetical protein [Bryobacteraceae bacterium]
MTAKILSISSVPRSAAHQWKEEAVLEGFLKALKALTALKPCSTRETISALENWAASGMLSEAEVAALMEFHGWERGS